MVLSLYSDESTNLYNPTSQLDFFPVTSGYLGFVVFRVGFAEFAQSQLQSQPVFLSLLGYIFCDAGGVSIVSDTLNRFDFFSILITHIAHRLRVDIALTHACGGHDKFWLAANKEWLDSTGSVKYMEQILDKDLPEKLTDEASNSTSFSQKLGNPTLTCDIAPQ